MTTLPIRNFTYWILAVPFFLLFQNCNSDQLALIDIPANSHISLIGGNLCSRMMNYGSFETELQLRFPKHQLYIRNMCDGGDTPGFRPHSATDHPFAFPGAEKFLPKEFLEEPSSEGTRELPDQWLTRHQTDIILAFFGSTESFRGKKGVDLYRKELSAFIDHTISQKYNGKTAAQLVLISPIAFEDLSDQFDLPNGVDENKRLSMYTKCMKEVAAEKNIPFINVFDQTNKWFNGPDNWTIDGLQMNGRAYEKFAGYLSERLLGSKSSYSQSRFSLNEKVNDKNWFWHNDYKIPNGVHVYGRRYKPFGPDNYPEELIKIRQLTANRDSAIWSFLKNETFDLNLADQKTQSLTPVKTNYQTSEKNGTEKYLYDDEAMATLKLANGFKVELFASEKDFPDLANPMQLSFDDRGRLWVACMPTYPHYKPGDPKPNDKIVILVDTDNDGKADQQKIFADKLHIPVGFEFAAEGVYVSQGTNLVLLQDTNGDDRADVQEIILSGFDDHDTHHVISAFCADPSGAIYMGEGVFLHTNVETPYGPVRGTDGGFYRYDVNKKKLERTAQISIPNPWGIAFDKYGQNFFAETSGPDIRWMMPSSINPRYGVQNPKSENLIEEKHLVRPTSGLEFISSRHFPEEMQGDLLVNNTIGFLGMKQHRVMDNETGFKTKHIQDLIVGSDKNFRPVDMEFAPDGSLYLVDWHNTLIGHMQHNARDPMRDHVHGRIYRITYPSRPLVEPAKIADASIEVLLNNLKLPEYRTRYRSRRRLRSLPKEDVSLELQNWVKNLEESSSDYERFLLEGLWTSWGINELNTDLLEKTIEAKDFRIRAAAVRALRYNTDKVEGYFDLLKKLAGDPNGRVRLEVITAASWLNKVEGLAILEIAEANGLDDWMQASFETARAHLNENKLIEAEAQEEANHLKGADLALYRKGRSIYQREGYCNTCHSWTGEGVAASNYPPIIGSEWALGNEDRLVKLTLKGVHGPMTVLGKEYPGNVAMMPYENVLTDEEISQVLTYIRNAFGNKASVISKEKVAMVRREVKAKEGFYRAEELVQLHPFK